MSGCLEGYIAIADRVLAGIDQKELLEKLRDESSTQSSASPELLSRVFYSTTKTNPKPIISMQNGKFSAFEAMAIKAGKVAATGTLKEARQAAGLLSKETDLESQCIVPGFVEPHIHTMLSAMLNSLLTDCDPLNKHIGGTFYGTKKFIQEQVKKLEKDQWFLGYGYDPSRLELKDGKFQDLTFDVFDDWGLNDEHPIFILNASGHLAYANQKAFHSVGKIDTSGPEYVKNNDNKLIGVMLEPAAYQPFINEALPSNALEAPEFVKALNQVVKDWSAKGFTTVFDAGVGMGRKKGWMDADLLHILSLGAPLHISGAAADLGPNDASHVVGDGKMPDGGATLLKIKTIKLWMDGSTQGFTAALETEYNNVTLPTYFGAYPKGWARWAVGSTCDKVNAPTDPNLHICDEMLAWANRGYQLMVHVNGDCAVDVVLDAFEKIAAATPPNPPIMHRLEHFTVASEAQVERAKKLNLAVSHTIGHVKYWGDTFCTNILGPKRAARIDPVKDDFDNDLVYSFHSDSPVSQADALSFVRTAATRLLYKKIDKILGKEQRVSVEAALAGVTINPAKQILLDSEIGSLEKGKQANFVVLTQDISSPNVDAAAIDCTWVKETWFKGVKRHG